VPLAEQQLAEIAELCVVQLGLAHRVGRRGRCLGGAVGDLFGRVLPTSSVLVQMNDFGSSFQCETQVLIASANSAALLNDPVLSRLLVS